MNTEQERADFEAAYAAAYPIAASRPDKFDREDWGDYVDASVGIGWCMYQAGRAALQSQDAEDGERLDFLDAANVPYKMGWNVGIAPAGNVSVSSVIQLGSTVTTIREAIDHARRIKGG